MLPSFSAAFALPEHSLASAAVAAAIEKAVEGKPVTSTSPTRARAWPSLPFLSARASALAPPNDTLFRLLGSTWLAAAAAAWSLRNASHHGKLSLATYRRLSLGLAASAAAEFLLFPTLALNLSWTGLALVTVCALAKVMGPMRMLPGEGFKRVRSCLLLLEFFFVSFFDYRKSASHGIKKKSKPFNRRSPSPAVASSRLPPTSSPSPGPLWPL